MTPISVLLASPLSGGQPAPAVPPGGRPKPGRHVPVTPPPPGEQVRDGQTLPEGADVKMSDHEREQAACVNADPTTFFPDKGSTVQAQAAIAICGRCDVRDACLTEALARPTAEDHGVWGGTTEYQRKQLRRRSGGQDSLRNVRAARPLAETSRTPKGGEAVPELRDAVGLSPVKSPCGAWDNADNYIEDESGREATRTPSRGIA